ncbi:RING finger protein [Yarrowia sp. C11]|nr:RING finger protein [Yarrowia sp. C11]KAG5365073.1 RING finger protein [Yarrowia sp. E02]
MSTDIRDFRESHSSDPYAGLLCDVGSDLECAICQSIMFVPFILDCGHNYCYPCLKQWFVNNNSCPECRTRICKAPTHSLTLKSLAESITDKMIRVEPSLKKPFARRKKEQVKPYTKDVKKKRVFPAFASKSSHHLDEEDGVQRCSQCHWELEEEEDRCTNCGVWVNDGSGREAAESINVDDEEEESDSRQPGEEISDYEDDGFVVDDDEVDDGGDVTGDVTILSDSQASSPAPTSTVQIDDSDLDSEDEQFLPKTKRQTEVTIDDSDDEEQEHSKRKHNMIFDSDDDQQTVSRTKKSRKIFSDSEDDNGGQPRTESKAIFSDSEEEEVKPKASRLKKKKRETVVVLSDEEEDDGDSSEDESEDDSDTDNEGITNGVYTGLPSRRGGGDDEEDNSEDDSEDDDLGGFVVDEAEEDGTDDEAEYSEEY